jgi:SSS family solute:Na+ symporter
MDQLLHRGKYAVKSDVAVGDKAELPTHGWRALIGITPEFSRGDRVLYFATMFWMLGWIVVFIIQLAINLVQVQPDSWWLNFWKYRFYIYLVVAVITTFWVGIGGFRDMVSFLKTLAHMARNDADDGRVVNHHNVGEDTPP